MSRSHKGQIRSRHDTSLYSGNRLDWEIWPLFRLHWAEKECAGQDSNQGRQDLIMFSCEYQEDILLQGHIENYLCDQLDLFRLHRFLENYSKLKLFS